LTSAFNECDDGLLFFQFKAGLISWVWTHSRGNTLMRGIISDIEMARGNLREAPPLSTHHIKSIEGTSITLLEEDFLWLDLHFPYRKGTNTHLL
jgi:hypothetical protein